MTLYDKLNQTMSEIDVNAYLELVHENAVFIFTKQATNFQKVNGLIWLQA